MCSFIIREGRFLAAVEGISCGSWSGAVYRHDGIRWRLTRAFGPGTCANICEDTYKLLHQLQADTEAPRQLQA